MIKLDEDGGVGVEVDIPTLAHSVDDTAVRRACSILARLKERGAESWLGVPTHCEGGHRRLLLTALPRPPSNDKLESPRGVRLSLFICFKSGNLCKIHFSVFPSNHLFWPYMKRGVALSPIPLLSNRCVCSTEGLEKWNSRQTVGNAPNCVTLQSREKGRVLAAETRRRLFSVLARASLPLENPLRARPGLLAEPARRSNFGKFSRTPCSPPVFNGWRTLVPVGLGGGLYPPGVLLGLFSTGQKQFRKYFLGSSAQSLN